MEKTETVKEEDGSSKELEEEEVASSNDKPESKEEEAKPTILPPEKKKLQTRASDQKKPAPVLKTPVSFKRPKKMLKKGESSQKKLKRSR